MVESPCVGICEMDLERELCKGCFRTSEEIAGWLYMSDIEKQSVWRAIAQRKAVLSERG